MTGDDDDDRILVIGSTDSTYCLGITSEDRLFLVTASFTIWDFLECLPC